MTYRLLTDINYFTYSVEVDESMVEDGAEFECCEQVTFELDGERIYAKINVNPLTYEAANWLCQDIAAILEAEFNISVESELPMWIDEELKGITFFNYIYEERE